MKYYVIDAFTNELFKGNPAGVCIFEDDLPDEIMQSIAFENNLAETAFLLKKQDTYCLRWFTPTVEMDLCGHATLATAYVVMSYIDASLTSIAFETKSGTLAVSRKGDMYTMDFPARKPKPVATPPLLAEALGCTISGTFLSRDFLVLLEKESDVLALQPNFELLCEASAEAFAVIVTAPGEECDFVSRFFAPDAGIIEDPVTGSSHCTLIPFWSERLHKTILTAKQLSQRGGTLYCEDCGSRVKISGTAVCYLQGDLLL